jgi:hypothetical protein
MDEIMKALYEGFAGFIRDFFKSASKQGFSIMLLLAAVVVLAFYLREVQGSMKDAQEACKADIARVENRTHVEIEALRTKLNMCDQERADLKYKVAELTAFVNYKLNKRK